jgi:O-acetylhomoserine/O-acetylserine sulfhydrylase-like pyridoxal-dependent enzyme
MEQRQIGFHQRRQHLMRGLKAGDEVIAMDDLYGGTYRLFTKNIRFRYNIPFCR